MKRLFIFALGMLLLGKTSLYALSLHDAQTQLFKGNLDLAILDLQKSQLTEAKSEAQAIWHPSIDAFGNYNYTTEVGHLTLPLQPPLQPIQRELGDHDRMEFGIDATYPLFTGFAGQNNIRSKKFAIASQEANIKALKNQMSLRLAGLYTAWSNADKQANFQNKTVEYAQQFTQQTEKFWKAGLVVKTQTLAAVARLKTAELELLATQNTRDSIRLELQSFLQVSLENNKPDTVIITALKTETESNLYDTSQNKVHAEIEALSLTQQQLDYQQKALGGQKLPQLFGMVGYRYANPGLNQTDDKFMNYGLAGLQLKWNLYDGTKNHSQRQQLRVQKQILETQKQKQISEFNKALAASQLQINKWDKQIIVVQASWEAANALAEDLRKQQGNGLATALEWLEAKNNLAKAQLQMEQAQNLKNLAVIQWQYAAGKELQF